MPTGRVAARRAATKEAILDAAWDLAHSEGLGRIGMRELASRLDMAASSLYEYFDGKDAIYDAMFVQGNEALRAHVSELETSDFANSRDALIAMGRAFVSFCDEDHARFQLLFQHSIPGWKPSDPAYATAVANLEAMRSFMASLGIADDESIDMWTALTSGLASQQVANDPGGDRWLRLVDGAVHMYIASRGATT